MWRIVTVAAAALLPLASAASSSTSDGSPTPDRDGKYWIYGDGISAAFIPYGASIANLVLRDQYGIERDVVAGFDNASYYSEDKQHPHLGGVPGRYANRIKNSTFDIDGHRYRVKANENPTEASPQGLDTLHGGPDGWDWRNFSVVSHSRSSVTFSFVDPDGKEGFPGEVVSVVTYALSGRDWDISMVAMATTKKTPIMLSSHTYWNLDGFANNQTNTALNHTLHMPYSGQRIGVDNILVPTGEILSNPQGSVNDFWSRPRQVGAAMDDPDLENNCGFNCTGYDNCFTVNRAALGSFDWRTEGPVATLSSDWSGIQLDVFTNQDAFQLYSCNGQNGTLALKKTQGVRDAEGADDFPRTIPKYGCVVLEVQDYIDGINHPEWMRKQVYGPSDDPYVLQAKYRFSLTSEHGGKKGKQDDC
ncbi:aldose 1-epimerase domain-containing protein [Hirsutella rhossiliensis]|uniref:Aldose 1-epimerase domain-containing protein n=1 Tax=Hirsutella rhossiliensis TaxID=111463 RepID=A0A9P8N282_9HYPO|nr:aldose 1-epimerase domain-containing protein [Hirsutella rhossiliensis]KAH0966908.1 aldose 1-epimerase domain-containing protein [Hirsutella rhossiliensis]